MAKLAKSTLNPVLPSHIAQSVRRLLLRHTGGITKRGDGMPIWVCVGGGPSSMALAYLLQNLPEGTLPVRLNVQAIIFDQSALLRTSKQSKVESWLSEIGVSSSMITARRQPNSADSLNVRGGLDGILAKHIHNGPVAKGMFMGLNYDDQIDDITATIVESYETCSFADLGAPGAYGTGNVTIPFSSGAHLWNPLLLYSEARLVDTCKHFGIPYEKSRTETSTSLRSIIRRLRESGCLPVALRETSIAQLSFHSIHLRKSLRTRAKEVLKTFRIHSWNLQSAVLVIELPHIREQLSPQDLSAYCWALAKVRAAVSAKDITAGDFDMFSAKGLQQLKAGSSGRSPSFTEGAARFEPIRLGSSTAVWRVSRIPLRNGSSTIGRRFILVGWVPARGVFPSELTEAQPLNKKLHMHTGTKPEHIACWAVSHILLFESTWWIKIAIFPDTEIQHLRIRRLKQSDHKMLENALRDTPHQKQVAFSQAINDAAPGRLQYTLPVVVYKGKILGFPTMNIYFADHVGEEIVVQWKVQYKCHQTASDLLDNCSFHEGFRPSFHSKMPHEMKDYQVGAQD